VKINMGIPTGMGIEPTVRYHLVGGFFKLSTDMLCPFDPELPAKRVRQLTLSGDVSWTLEIVGYFASKEWGYMNIWGQSASLSFKNTAFPSPMKRPRHIGLRSLVPMDVSESGDDFLGAGGLSQSDAQRMRSPDSIGFLSYIMIF
jgi:hypothetical protein